MGMMSLRRGRSPRNQPPSSSSSNPFTDAYAWNGTRRYDIPTKDMSPKKSFSSASSKKSPTEFIKGSESILEKTSDQPHRAVQNGRRALKTASDRNHAKVPT